MSLYKTSDPWKGGIFLPQGYNMNNYGKGPLDKTKFQISKAFAFSFKQEDF